MLPYPKGSLGCGQQKHRDLTSPPGRVETGEMDSRRLSQFSIDKQMGVD
jgi:hypothetical protein